MNNRQSLRFLFIVLLVGVLKVLAYHGLLHIAQSRADGKPAKTPAPTTDEKDAAKAGARTPAERDKARKEVDKARKELGKGDDGKDIKL